MAKRINKKVVAVLVIIIVLVLLYVYRDDIFASGNDMFPEQTPGSSPGLPSSEVPELPPPEVPNAPPQNTPVEPVPRDPQEEWSQLTLHYHPTGVHIVKPGDFCIGENGLCTNFPNFQAAIEEQSKLFRDKSTVARIGLTCQESPNEEWC
jgi:hypothetical protein